MVGLSIDTLIGCSFDFRVDDHNMPMKQASAVSPLFVCEGKHHTCTQRLLKYAVPWVKLLLPSDTCREIVSSKWCLKAQCYVF
jgi:hypothetical protein